jgi:hypothetical protein
MTNDNQNGTTTFHLALAWAWVGIPLLIGVILTISNAMKLFQSNARRSKINGAAAKPRRFFIQDRACAVERRVHMPCGCRR